MCNFIQHNLFRIEVVMLCRDYDCFNSFWFVVVTILKCNLRFCVRAQILDFVIFAAELGQLIK
ncbi:hypothetical protein D3C71_1452940 [compost metagenome]